jgi:hypothetical protein
MLTFRGRHGEIFRGKRSHHLSRKAQLRTMLRLQPLTRSVDLQTRAVDQYVQRTMRH